MGYGEPWKVLSLADRSAWQWFSSIVIVASGKEGREIQGKANFGPYPKISGESAFSENLLWTRGSILYPLTLFTLSVNTLKQLLVTSFPRSGTGRQYAGPSCHTKIRLKHTLSSHLPPEKIFLFLQREYNQPIHFV